MKKRNEETIHDLFVGTKSILSFLFFLGMTCWYYEDPKEKAPARRNDERGHRPAPREEQSQEVEMNELKDHLDYMEEEGDGETISDQDTPEQGQPLRMDDERCWMM